MHKISVEPVNPVNPVNPINPVNPDKGQKSKKKNFRFSYVTGYMGFNRIFFRIIRKLSGSTGSTGTKKFWFKK